MLIELLITIAIIAILSSFIAISTRINQDKARDSVRKSNLAVLDNALTAYLIDKGSYPPPIALNSGTEFTSDEPGLWLPGLTTDYLKTLPKDPRQSAIQYFFAAVSNFLGMVVDVGQSKDGKVAAATSNSFLQIIRGPDFDEGLAIAETADGGYIVSGSTRSYGAGGHDILLIKSSANGSIAWSKSIGKANSYDYGADIKQTSDGGYIIVGNSTQTSYLGLGSSDLLIVKVNSSGDLIWSKTWGGSQNDSAHSVQIASDGYVAVGSTNSFGSGNNDLLITKFDLNGNLLWSKVAGGTDDDQGVSIQQTTDAGYIITGRTKSFGAGGNDLLLSKFDSAGNHLWSKSLGGTGTDYGQSIQQTSDGQYIVAGSTVSSGNGDFWITKFDPSGNLLWSKTSGGSSFDAAYSIAQTTDGGYVATGWTNSFGANDLLLTKFDSNGNLLWSKTSGGTIAGYALALRQTSDSGYIITGRNFNFDTGDVLLLKTDSEGNIGSCGNMIPASITVNANSLTLKTLSPTIISPVATIASPSLTISSPTPTINTLCQPVLPSPSPQLSPPSSPQPSPFVTGCGNKKRVYCYIVSPDRSAFILWAQLENPADQDTITHYTSTCSNITPPSPEYNYCLKSP